jgi:hypothetical protein
MSTSKLLAVAVLVIAIGAAVAGFTRSTEMPQQTTVIEILDHTSQTGGQSELASITRADEWLNSPPLTPSALRGKVVLIDFWTYTCINWLRTAPSGSPLGPRWMPTRRFCTNCLFANTQGERPGATGRKITLKLTPAIPGRVATMRGC